MSGTTPSPLPKNKKRMRKNKIRVAGLLSPDGVCVSVCVSAFNVAKQKQKAKKGQKGQKRAKKKSKTGKKTEGFPDT